MTAMHSAIVTPAVATTFAGPSSVLPIAALAIALLIGATWVVSLRLKDASVIDPVWGPAFVLVAIIAALAGHGDAGRRLLLLALTAVWGLRLGWYLTRRKFVEREEDRRYRAMRELHGDDFALWSLRWVYLVQGVLVLVISLPVQVGSQRPNPLSWAIAPGIAVYLIGLAFEAIGDEQLRRFKSRPENRGRVMDRGLWRYTRHPNYFGDACVWWGTWLVVLQAGGTWWTVIGPVVMTILLVRVSGKGLLERDIGERRPGYPEYIRRTSGFIPLPPRS
jgi:steroid 5-alpha reductase family enzyme